MTSPTESKGGLSMGGGVSIGSSTEKALSVVDSICRQPFRSNIVELPVEDLLLPESSPRTAGENTDHTRMLAESAKTTFPPIVVDRATMNVIDGVHRLRAAQLRGDKTIAAVLFDGRPAEAFVLAVKLNTEHGLPLSLADRKAAAQRILFSYPDWSNRLIAAIAGISHNTVAAVRRRSAGQIDQSTGRMARNGVWHRSDGHEGRQRAAQLFAADPTVSARQVALEAGISVTTAKEVRKRLRADRQPVASHGAAAGAAVAPASGGTVTPAATADDLAQWATTEQILHQLSMDPSLRFTEVGRRLLRSLATPLGDGSNWDTLIHHVPPHCLPSVAALARRRSQDWQRLAQLLDQRADAKSVS
ncbi:ParB/RepB/Spo0J family partition protein [Nocardia terpenica]|nr:ParB N-terminal domain-containing protein [Nocardia terpenica]